MTPAASGQAGRAYALVKSLQDRFVRALEAAGGVPFDAVEWLRDEGCHGGGRRFGVADTEWFGRASVNVSQVHYDDEPERQLGSASALSTIVHPTHPQAPSVHIHISWTEMKDGSGYWRMMADLNPSLPQDADTTQFSEALRKVAPEWFDDATVQGEHYFYIPALKRHRGVAHFYLENFNTGSTEKDIQMARSVGETAIDIYVEIVAEAMRHPSVPTDEQKVAQLAYHTLYLFQVLTLDRGTTMGLLVHDQNDVGILGSLPPRIDRNLLASWRSRMPEPQDLLLDKLLAALPNQGVCTIDEDIKRQLAAGVRAHYKAHPEGLEFQASGNSTPPTLENHR